MQPPETTTVYRHTTPIQTRFNDIDILGHVNNSVYLQYFDLAKTRYFIDALQTDPRQAPTVAIVNINLNFYAPAYFTDSLAVETAVTHLSERSLTIDQRIVDTETGQTKCTALTVMAGFDPATASGAPIDTALAEKIRRFEQTAP